MKTRFYLLAILSFAMFWISCGDDDDNDTGSDTDTDTDTFTDTGTDADTDTDIDTDVDGDTDTDTDTDTDAIEIVDPCIGMDTPGEYAVDGGPDIELPEGYLFDLELDNQPTYTLASTATGPVAGNEGNGTWYLKRTNGQEGVNGGEIATDAYGDFSVTFPTFCEEQLLKASWENEVGRYCLVHSVNNINCEEGDIKVTLSWGAGVYDLELHLIRDGGQINNLDSGDSDCTWTNMNPDWGVYGDTSDNPSKDADWTGDNGIENITLPNPENIVYHVMVEYWASGVAADASVVFNVEDHTTVAQISGLVPYEVWYVGTINWPERSVTLLDQITDCSGDWSGGCQMDIP